MDPYKVCQVCYLEAPKNSTHCTHYGAVCCFNCQAFFRRLVQINKSSDLSNVSLPCRQESPGQRCNMMRFGKHHKCRKCRLDRCLEVGLKPEAVLLDEETRAKFTGFNKRKLIKPNVVTQFQQLNLNPTSHLDESEKYLFGDSIIMDFMETVTGAEIPPSIYSTLNQFFVTGNLSQDSLSQISTMMRDIFIKFLSKSMFYKSLAIEDQMRLINNNLQLLVHFCLSQFATAKSVFDQFSWLLITITPPVELLKSNDLRKMSLKELLYDNGCLKDTEQWKIYWKCCQEVQDVLKQNFPHVGMALHLIFFNIELWEQDNLDNLLEKSRIRSMYEVFLSEISEDVLESKKMFRHLIANLNWMNLTAFIPSTPLKENNQIVLNMESAVLSWIGLEFQKIDVVYCKFRPPDLDGLVESSLKLRVANSQDHAFLRPELSRFMAHYFNERTKEILGTIIDLTRLPCDLLQDLEKRIFPSAIALHMIKLITYESAESQIKFFCGFPDDFDLGINSQIPGATWEWLNENKSFITNPEDFYDLMENVKWVNEAIEDMNTFKIVLFLLITEYDFKSLEAYRSNVLLALSYFHSDKKKDENEIIKPYFDILSRVKRIQYLARDYFVEFTL